MSCSVSMMKALRDLPDLPEKGMIRATSRPEAPWFVVPADHKWFARLVVAAAVIEALERLDLRFPKVGAATLKEMRQMQAALAAEAPRKKR